MNNQIVRLAKELIAIPSVSRDVKKLTRALKVVNNHLNDFPVTSFVSQQTPSLLFSNQHPETKKFKIILNAHLDVVTGTKEQFTPFVKNGRLYGRGAYDMKAAAAVMILLFKEMANKISYPLGLQLTGDEEISGLNGTNYQIQQGIRGDFVIFGECNTNLQIGNEAKGILIMRLNTIGKSSHGAYPWLGQNALLRMYEVLASILKAFPTAKNETFETTVNLTKIECTNSAVNKIPDNCTAILDIRFAAKDENTIIARIKNLLPDDVILTFDDSRKARFTDPQNSYIKTLRKLTKKIHGKTLPFKFTHGTSDAPFYGAVGCDAIEFGPIGEGAHINNEWVDIQSLEDYYNILKAFLLEVEKEYNST